MVKGLNALLAIVSTPLSAPVIAATRLRRSPTNSAKGAARLVSDALATSRKAGSTGQVAVRADSAYYNHDVIAAARAGGALFSTWRHHAGFTDSRELMLAAEATHRDHAIVEKVIAELKDGALAHPPSGHMNANGAWLVLAAIAFSLTRAAGTQASRFHARATTATIWAQLIAVPARIARSARLLRLHLPERWPWEDAWEAMFTATGGPPIPTT